MEKEFLEKIRPDLVRLKIWVQPGAKRNIVDGTHDNCLKLKIKAPAKDNKANEELIKFLAEIFNVKKKDIEIVSGQKTRKKIIDIKIKKNTDLTKIIKRFF